ncbi:hypothetical protein M5689_013253 [Euphorbia peplus]|nr:hypothetical protein M5689_013253 [Euphorbia peplus]
MCPKQFQSPNGEVELEFGPWIRGQGRRQIAGGGERWLQDEGVSNGGQGRPIEKLSVMEVDTNQATNSSINGNSNSNGNGKLSNTIVYIHGN